MKVLLFAPFAFPDSCANAVRVITFAKMFRDAGCDVEVLGVANRGEELEGTSRGVDYKMIRALPFYGMKAYKRINELKKGIIRHLESNSYDLILLNHIYFDYSHLFIRYAKKTGTRLIFNAVEWYERDNEQFQGLRGKVNLVKNRIALRFIHAKMKNIIAISSLLEKHYNGQGCNTIKIPTIIDVKEYVSVASITGLDNKKLRVAYAGSPARKDYMLNAINALSFLSDEDRARLEFHFYGPENKALYSLGLTEEFLNAYKENIFCHGRIPYAEVKEKIAAADFTVLLRPNKRYANAGFPTKVGESMACGTPVIANLTSDLGEYIIDGKTGIVCENESPEACAEAFRRALAMTADKKTEMRTAAYEMANAAFDYRTYIDKMSEFLHKVRM